MITISDVSARIAGRLLLDHATVSLPSGTKAGLVGRSTPGMAVNASGRSSKSSPLCASDKTVFQQWGENGRASSAPQRE